MEDELNLGVYCLMYSGRPLNAGVGIVFPCGGVGWDATGSVGLGGAAAPVAPGPYDPCPPAIGGFQGTGVPTRVSGGASSFFK